MDDNKTNTDVKPFNEEVRSRLAAYKDRNRLSHNALAKEMGMNSSYVCVYLQGRPNPSMDIARFEAIAEDLLLNESRRIESKTRNFDTPISRALEKQFEIVRETNDVGLSFGQAGIGKSRGIEIYVASHPNTIAITATQWRAAASDIQGAIWRSISTRGYDGRTKRGDFIASRLAGSNRLVIVDNAHRLKPGGLQWLFDFHDETGCPLALVGNPEVLEVIRKNDQMYSRIGHKSDLVLDNEMSDKEIREASIAIIKQVLPEAVEELSDFCQIVAENNGHFRAVHKQLLLARKIKENAKGSLTWSQAFRGAHKRLVRDYVLQ